MSSKMLFACLAISLFCALNAAYKYGITVGIFHIHSRSYTAIIIIAQRNLHSQKSGDETSCTFQCIHQPDLVR